jgi:hypothetical protein
MVRALIVLVIFTSACARVHSQKSKGGDEQVKEYREDLSVFRPRYEVGDDKKETTNQNQLPPQVVPKNDINRFLAEKLDSVYSYNEKITSADGFRILVYVGTSSEEARTQRSYAYQALPLERSYTDWKSPTFKVKVGDFVDKLEAYYAYAKLIKVFPSAIVVPDKVNIVREK